MSVGKYVYPQINHIKVNNAYKKTDCCDPKCLLLFTYSTYYLLFLFYNILFLVFVVIAATEILYIISENCLTITVHEIQPGDRRTDRRTDSEVSVIESRFTLWVRNP